METKICKNCKLEKGLDQYYNRYFENATYLSGKCKKCLSDYSKKYYINNKEKVKLTKQRKIENSYIEEFKWDINQIEDLLKDISRKRGYLTPLDIYRLTSLYIDCYGLTSKIATEPTRESDVHNSIVFMYNEILKFYKEKL